MSSPDIADLARSTYAIPSKPIRSTRLPRSGKRRFAMIGEGEIAAYGRCLGPHVALQLVLVMLANTQWVRKQEGWTKPSRDLLQQAGLSDRRVRERAVRRAIELSWIETRPSRGRGSRLEYRLLYCWFDGASVEQSAGKIVDLKTVRAKRAPNRR